MFQIHCNSAFILKLQLKRTFQSIKLNQECHLTLLQMLDTSAFLAICCQSLLFKDTPRCFPTRYCRHRLTPDIFSGHFLAITDTSVTRRPRIPTVCYTRPPLIRARRSASRCVCPRIAFQEILQEHIFTSIYFSMRAEAH